MGSKFADFLYFRWIFLLNSYVNRSEKTVIM